MFGLEAYITTVFAPLVYEPLKVYLFVVAFMVASSFGLPIPEEVVLVSSGLLAHMAQDPVKYPPPFPGAEGVNTITLCIVATFIVFFSDCLVYFLGKVFGAKIIKTKFFQKQVAGETFERINRWFQKYGGLACGIFRFTPGVRFPGHLSCGLLGIPVWKFMAIDAIAVLVSVPTQIYLVSKYGHLILDNMEKVKLVVFTVGAVAIAFYFGKKYYRKKFPKPTV